MDQTLIERFEPYFRHHDPNHHVLKVGDRAVACKNIKAALVWIGILRTSGGDPQLFDDHLSHAVRRFQDQTKHGNVDGCVGPGTRRKLVERILTEFGYSRFNEFDGSNVVRIPTIFLSYAWKDSEPVDKLDQWLRDHGVRVIRDSSAFQAGSNLKEVIKKSVQAADKVIAVYSKRSKARDWPNFERQIAEEIEQQLKANILIYLCLDDTPLKAHDPHRIAIRSKGRMLKQIGADILKALDIPLEQTRYEYNEDEPL